MIIGTSGKVLEYLEFTQLSNIKEVLFLNDLVLEYLEFTQLSNHLVIQDLTQLGFRVPGIYTALKLLLRQSQRLIVLEYLEFTQLSNMLSAV